jgi:hypothetical protein
VVSVLVVSNGFHPQIKNYTIGICCFSAKHAAVKYSERNDGLAHSMIMVLDILIVLWIIISLSRISGYFVMIDYCLNLDELCCPVTNGI